MEDDLFQSDILVRNMVKSYVNLPVGALADPALDLVPSFEEVWLGALSWLRYSFHVHKSLYSLTAITFGLRICSVERSSKKLINLQKIWIRRGLNPGPFECKSNVIPLHHKPTMIVVVASGLCTACRAVCCTEIVLLLKVFLQASGGSVE